MGKLATLAKTKTLKGKVTVTDTNGVTTTYENEAAAEKATEGQTVEHRRGAFFIKAEDAEPAPKAAPKRK